MYFISKQSIDSAQPLCVQFYIDVSRGVVEVTGYAVGTTSRAQCDITDGC